MSTILIAMSLVLMFSPQASAGATGGILHIPSTDSLAHCIASCGDVAISYPFGIGHGCFRQAFDLTCDQSTENPRLFLGSSNIQVTDMDSSGKALASPIIFNLTTRPGTNTYNMSWEAPTEGITISSDNTLFVAGFDFDVTLFEYGTGDIVGSCMSRCAGKKAPTGVPCNGIGCCHIPLPRDLPGFQAKLVSTNTTATQSDWLHPGIMAFVSLVDYTLTSNTTAVFSSWTNASNIDGALLSVTIMDQPSCESAHMNNTSYACSKGSSCQNSSSGTGYWCDCTSYGGNPYILDGCMKQDPFPFGHEEGCSGNDRFRLNCTSGHAELIIREVVLPIAVLVGSVLVWFTLSWYRWKRTRDSFAQGIIGLRRFECSVLAAATGKFSEEKRLGEGAFGAVYGGSLMDENGREQKVAVKKIKDTRGNIKDFHAELKTISETRHMNLVRLIGWCCSPTMMDVMCWSRQQNVKLFLVYELVSNSNLDYHLHRRDKVLPWPTRYQIVKGIASAIHYLHHESKPYILHRDIKPSKILLDDRFNAKLADFGLSRIANHNSTTPPTMAIGTEGYIDPQCRKHGLVKFGRHSDVYSFGIVLLDIACTDMSREQVWELYRHNTEPQVEAAVDAKLCGVFDRKQMERVVVLGLRCSDPDGDKRPSMHDAIQFLEHGIELPATIKRRYFSHLDDRGSVSSSIMSADEEVLQPPGVGASFELTAVIKKEDDEGVSITIMSADEEVLTPPGAGSSTELT